MVIPKMNYQYKLTHFKCDMGLGVASDGGTRANACPRWGGNAISWWEGGH